MEATRNSWKCSFQSSYQTRHYNPQLDSCTIQVVSLLKERFPSFSDALAADIAMSPTVVGADQRSAINITDGASATQVTTLHLE